MPPKEIDATVADLRKQSGFDATPRETHRAMSADEARSARSATVKFGSHGLTHAYLPVLDPEEKRREIADSRGRCEATTGAMPTTFAYPYGRFDSVSERLAEAAGYVGACTTERAFLDSRSRPFALPRLHVGNWGLRRFRYMLDGRW
jgi:peptidoglycan/xylan/chitin deacetylase (PgdA/CDA1 family)